MFAPLEARSYELERRLVDMDMSIRRAYDIKDEDEEMLDALDGIVKGEGTADNDGGGTNGGGKVGGGRYATWTPVGLPKQNSVVCVGRVCNEAHEGRLNRASILLEGSRKHSLGSRIKLDLGGCTKTTATIAMGAAATPSSRDRSWRWRGTIPPAGP